MKCQLECLKHGPGKCPAYTVDPNTDCVMGYLTCSEREGNVDAWSLGHGCINTSIPVPGDCANSKEINEIEAKFNSFMVDHYRLQEGFEKVSGWHLARDPPGRSSYTRVLQRPLPRVGGQLHILHTGHTKFHLRAAGKPDLVRGGNGIGWSARISQSVPR